MRHRQNRRKALESAKTAEIGGDWRNISSLGGLESSDFTNAFVGQGKYDEAMAVGELAAAEPWVVAAMMLRSMLREGPPRLGTRTGVFGPGPAAVVRAYAGFEAAVESVLANDHAAALALWEARRPRLLEIHRALDGDEEVLAHRPDAVAAVRAVWEERTAALRESSRKGNVTAAAAVRVCQVLRRLGQWDTEILSTVKPTLSAATTFGEQASALRAMQEEMGTVAETAAAQINTQTRRVLDLDVETRSVVVKKWLEELSR